MGKATPAGNKRKEDSSIRFHTRYMRRTPRRSQTSLNIRRFPGLIGAATYALLAARFLDQDSGASLRAFESFHATKAEMIRSRADLALAPRTHDVA
jgi:hypothetical protein